MAEHDLMALILPQVISPLSSPSTITYLALSCATNFACTVRDREPVAK